MPEVTQDVKKKWYETKVGKVLTNPYLSQVGALAKGISKGIEKDTAVGRELKQRQEQTIQDLQKMQLAPETTTALGLAQQVSSQGLDPYTRAQILQELSRRTASMSGLYGQSRLGLAKAVDLNKDWQRGLMQFGSTSAQARRASVGLGIQTGLGVGQQRLGLEQYKTQGLYNYLTGRRSERRQNLSNLLTGLASVGGQIGAAALGAPKG